MNETGAHFTVTSLIFGAKKVSHSSN